MKLPDHSYLFGWLIGIFMLYGSCNSSMRHIAGPRLQALGGTNWFSQEYLLQLDTRGTPAGAVESPCLELSFNASFDSMAVIRGGRSITVHTLKPVSDSSFLAPGFDGDAGLFIVEDQGKTVAYQSTSGTVPFKRMELKYMVRNLNHWRTGTELFLNERLFADKYFLLNPDNEPTSVVLFTGYGELVGLANYKTYKACYDRACFPAHTFDVVELADGRMADRFIWEWQNDTLRFYSILVRGPGIGQHDKGAEIFKFVKKR